VIEIFGRALLLSYIKRTSEKEVIRVTRKKLAIIGGCVGLVVVAILVWALGFGHSSDGSASSSSTQTTSTAPSQDEVAKKEVAAAAAKLAVDLTSGDPTKYKEAYSPGNAPEMLPAGTKIAVKPNTVYTLEAFGRVDATVKAPGWDKLQVVVVLERTENGWLVQRIEKVG
jgi:guanyl-specific ribonuclease Sa